MNGWQSGRQVEVIGMFARERAPPAGVEPPECRLFSNQSIAGLQEGQTLINWYRGALGGRTLLPYS